MKIMDWKNVKVLLRPEWKKIIFPLLVLYVLATWLFPQMIDRILYPELSQVVEAISVFLFVVLSGFVSLLPTELVKVAGLIVSIFFWYFYSSFFLQLYKKKPELAVLALMFPIILNLICIVYAYFSYVSYT